MSQAASPFDADDELSIEDTVKRISRRIQEDYVWSSSDFEIGKRIGHGKFGKVYVVREKYTHLLFGMKMMSKSQLLEEGHGEQVLKEIEIHRQLKHPNIVRLFNFFHDEHRLYIVLEFCYNGTLHSLLRKKRFLSEREAAKYIYQAADALDYCSKLKIIHRDVKPENLLLDLNNDLKLSDFGWATVKTGTLNKVCGTVEYFPPEMVMMKTYDLFIDRWSLGVLCYELLVGTSPFYSESEDLILVKIVENDYFLPQHLSPLAKDFISKLLQHDPKKRMSFNEAMIHRWAVNNYILPPY